MKFTISRSFRKPMLSIVMGLFLCLTMAITPPLVRAGDIDSKEQFLRDDTSVTGVDSGYQNYSGLADLVTTICEDAMERFEGFYGPFGVMVYPFPTIGLFEKNKQSELGATLANQMVAMINNETKDHLGKVRGDTKQELTGVLQEIDGYLRVHVSGVNAAGQRTSFVVIVEMSEPIYRALHTYL